VDESALGARCVRSRDFCDAHERQVAFFLDVMN